MPGKARIAKTESVIRLAPWHIMSTVILSILVLFATLIAGAQTPVAPEGPPDLQVVKYSWSKERIGWERDPLASEVFGQEVRSRALRERPSGSILADRSEKVQEAAAAKSQPPAPPRYSFTYKLSVHNTGPKTIKEIDWDHVFRNAATGEELGRREFTAVEKIAPGKRKELSVFTPSPPTPTISIYKLVKNEREGLVEQVMVLRVLYDDGTTWQAR
jgi:hypothetical protein